MKLRIKTRKTKSVKILPFLSIIIPAYNEVTRIGETLRRIQQFLKFKGYRYEIIVVDDGSTDGTAKLVQNYSRKISQIRLVKNAVNRGKGYSVRSGMRRAQGRLRLFMDADSSVDISYVDEFISWVERGYDVVIGSINVEKKDITEHNGWHRRFLGEAANLLIRILATPKISDTQRGFKLFTARAAKKIFARQTVERFGFDIEVLVIARKNKYGIKEVPVIWDNPAGSKVGLLAYIETLQELLLITFNRIIGRYSA